MRFDRAAHKKVCHEFQKTNYLNQSVMTAQLNKSLLTSANTRATPVASYYDGFFTPPPTDPSQERSLHPPTPQQF